MMIITKYAIYLSREDDNGEINAFTRFMICWVCRSYLSGLDCSVLSPDEFLIEINYGRFLYVFDAWRKWSCGVVCVWLRTNSDTIVGMFIWFCYLEWMISDLLTTKIYQVEGTILVSVRNFVNKINTYRLKRW